MGHRGLPFRASVVPLAGFRHARRRAEPSIGAAGERDDATLESLDPRDDFGIAKRHDPGRLNLASSPPPALKKDLPGRASSWLVRAIAEDLSFAARDHSAAPRLRPVGRTASGSVVVSICAPVRSGIDHRSRSSRSDAREPVTARAQTFSSKAIPFLGRRRALSRSPRARPPAPHELPDVADSIIRFVSSRRTRRRRQPSRVSEGRAGRAIDERDDRC